MPLHQNHFVTYYEKAAPRANKRFIFLFSNEGCDYYYLELYGNSLLKVMDASDVAHYHIKNVRDGLHWTPDIQKALKIVDKYLILI